MKILTNMNSFNKTEAAVFSCRLCFLRAIPFISLFFFIGHLDHPKMRMKPMK